MKMRTSFIAGASLIALGGLANADDHLVQAELHGLSPDSQAFTRTQAFTESAAGHSGDLAPGQGSPFSGEETKTPATDTEAANEHANVKERGAE
jgi:hypothetical protein